MARNERHAWRLLSYSAPGLRRKLRPIRKPSLLTRALRALGLA